MKGLSIFKNHFRECPRGVIVEEHLKHNMELRTVTLFGKVMIAANEAGLKIERNGSIFDSPDTPDWVM